MTYCINPNCQYFNTPVHQNKCNNCSSDALVQGRYRVIQPLSNGSFGQLFEVEDINPAAHGGNTRKVLKVLLRSDYPPIVSLFKREAKVLSELKHPGIPKVEPDGYFRWHPNSLNPSHYLVMEKIEGINLYEWLRSRNNQPITEEQAIAWLKQLVEILQLVHKCNYFHRDIKPSNIMLKPDGQLVLIDFGAVREVTETYLRRLEGSSGTAIISPGYTPPEQADGRAVSSSDFYALGRTFVHLLTGIHPHDIAQNPHTGELYWRENALPIRQELVDLINGLMAPLAANRPRNAQEILQRLQEIENNRINSKKYLNHFLIKVFNLVNRGGRNRVKIGLGFSLILLFLGVGAGLAFYDWEKTKACDSKPGDFLSCGEETLVPGSIGNEKEEGIKEFTLRNYDKAATLLTKAREKNPKDPETLIYLNNARLGNKKAYTIAVVAPISKSPDIALEILRGAAQAQEEINQGKKIRGMSLRVMIADDKNDGTQAKKIAHQLVSKEDILAVIGHYASEVTLEVVPVYQKHELVVISPGSTSEELSQWGKIPHHFFFRTVPTTKVAADYLVRHLNNKFSQKTAAVFNVPQSSFSRSLSTEFRTSFLNSSREVLDNEFDLSSSGFNAEAAIKQAQKQGATVLAVFPDGGTSTNGIPNTLRLIRANRGSNWIVGSNTLYSRDTLELLGEDALNRFVVVTTWHYLDSHQNPEFPQAARRLWKGDVSWRSAMAYDATRVLITALEKQSSPSRERLRKVLADKHFQAQGATGMISFDGGDRKESFSTLVKVVRSECSSVGYAFVPVDYQNLAEGLCQ